MRFFSDSIVSSTPMTTETVVQSDGDGNSIDAAADRKEPVVRPLGWGAKETPTKEEGGRRGGRTDADWKLAKSET
jgi:hypothetical protein